MYWKDGFMEYYQEILFKLVLAIVLGAVIGFERELTNRPAGLRTNILVCLGATLVQIISIEIFANYHQLANVDPARLGAQVISGIGFLGAGTIIREGANIKGLTTAASLWVVACIGLAIGQGVYIPAIMAAILSYVVLTALRGAEGRMFRKSPYLNIDCVIDNRPGQIGTMGKVFGDMCVSIKNIEFRDDEGDKLTVFFSLMVPRNTSKDLVIKKLMEVDGVLSIERL